MILCAGESLFQDLVLHAFRLNARTQRLRNLCFFLLGHGTTYAPRGKDVDIDVETIRVRQMKEAYEKMFTARESGDRDLSCWRIELFEKLCSKTHTTVERNAPHSGSADYFFQTEEANLTYRNFREFESGPFEETSISTKIRLDVIISDAIKNFFNSLMIVTSWFENTYSG